MKKTWLLSIIALALSTACVVVPAGRRGEVVVPFLPPLVVLGAEPYYFHGGFYYHYSNNNWYYSKSRSGPWTDLPRDHYPKEVRHKGREQREERGRGRDRREEDRGHDYRR